jgi:hypothetical protein
MRSLLKRFLSQAWLPWRRGRTEPESVRSDVYLSVAVQYYVAGRSAVFAASAPVAGNLFHHAIEMYLKYRLIEKGYTQEQLWRRFGHRLKKLWKRYKKISQNSTLAKFDSVISSLDQVEELRYPGDSFGFFIDFRKGSVSSLGQSKTHPVKQYRINLEEMDELMTALFTGCVTQDWINSLLIFGDAREQYLRDNLHSFV